MSLIFFTCWNKENGLSRLPILISAPGATWRAKGELFMNRDGINALPLEDDTRATDELIAELESNRHGRQVAKSRSAGRS